MMIVFFQERYLEIILLGVRTIFSNVTRVLVTTILGAGIIIDEATPVRRNDDDVQYHMPTVDFVVNPT
jgi:hypothetical protein